MSDKTDKKSKLDGETKNDEEPKLTALSKWLHSKNNFKKAIKLTEDINVDTNNVKSSSGDKKVFNNLAKLINDIKKNYKKKYHWKNKEHCFWSRSTKAKRNYCFSKQNDWCCRLFI